MSNNDNQCRALKRDGNRCPNPAKFGGFCGRHYPKKSRGGGTLAGIAKGAQVVAVAAGAIELVHKIVEVWQALCFGPGPGMPSDYRYLTKQFGPSYPISLSSIGVFAKGPDSVDWQKARQVYEASKTILAQIEAGQVDPDTFASKLAQLDQDTNTLFSSMQPPLEKLICRQIGEDTADEIDNEVNE